MRFGVRALARSNRESAAVCGEGSSSTTKLPHTQQNHIFASFMAFTKLENYRTRTHLNNFALQAKLYEERGQMREKCSPLLRKSKKNMISKKLLTFCSALALSTAGVSMSPARAQTAAPANVDKVDRPPLSQVKGDGVTIQLKRARWASGAEVLAWPWVGKQLTLWFDAQTAPEIAIPAGHSAADYIVNVRLIDEHGEAVQVFPIDLVRSLHRTSLPYVPASPRLEIGQQSLWRAQPFDPNFKAVKLQIEWLKPGHPFTAKTLPASLLERKEGAPIAPEAAKWLQTVEIKLAADQIEPGQVDKTPTIVAEAKNEKYRATLYRWQLGTRKITANGETRELPYLKTSLVLTALSDAKTKDDTPALPEQIMVIARNERGETLKHLSFPFDAERYFAANGAPVAANQRNIDVDLDFGEKPFETAGQWSLEIQNYGDESSLIQLNNLPAPVAGERKATP